MATLETFPFSFFSNLIATSTPVNLSIPRFTSPNDPDPIFSLTSNLSAKLATGPVDAGGVDGTVLVVGDWRFAGCDGETLDGVLAGDGATFSAGVFFAAACAFGGEMTLSCEGDLAGDGGLGGDVVGKCGICIWGTGSV